MEEICSGWWKDMMLTMLQGYLVLLFCIFFSKLIKIQLYRLTYEKRKKVCEHIHLTASLINLSKIYTTNIFGRILCILVPLVIVEDNY